MYTLFHGAFDKEKMLRAFLVELRCRNPCGGIELARFSASNRNLKTVPFRVPNKSHSSPKPVPFACVPLDEHAGAKRREAQPSAAPPRILHRHHDLTETSNIPRRACHHASARPPTYTLALRRRAPLRAAPRHTRSNFLHFPSPRAARTTSPARSASSVVTTSS
jgi:hypothetical protein